MRLDLILGLPASILFLIASHTTSATPLESSSSLEPELESLEEGTLEHNVLRRGVVEEHLRMGRSPIGVMKMPADEGQKFYMEYWQFKEDNELPLQSLRSREDETRLLSNGSMAIPYRAPFALHLSHGTDLRARAAEVLAILEKRDFLCPTGYAACSAIGFPNSCCASDENCFRIQETGLGPVGCCPKGDTCGGTITSCNAPNTPCAQDLGGGCCIPNYVCEGVGCVFNSTVIVTPSSTLIGTSSIPVVIVPGTTTVSTTVSSSTPVATSTSSTSIVFSTTSTPASTSTSTTATMTVTGVPPVRPTSVTITSSPSTTTEAPGTACPTGFYACSAHYDGGCCQINRDCAKLSCPATSSTTIISSGQTIVVPVGSAATVATPTGPCATGWSTCAASVGGNCCPSGWECGTASCTSLSPSATGLVQKGSPSRGLRLTIDFNSIVFTVCLASILML